MIIHAGFLPHSPLLLKEIHPERHDELEETLAAIEHLRNDLYALKPDVLVVISGHGDRYADAFSIDLAPRYQADLKPFGDLSEPKTFFPATGLIDKIQRHLRKESTPFTLTTNELLEYGTSVVLRLLSPVAEEANIIPIAYADLDPKDHVQFGKHLRNILEDCKERVAVIATGDLSHCLSADAPGGYRAEGEVFDQTVVQAVEHQSLSNLLGIPESVVEAAQESGYLPLLTLYGVLDARRTKTEVLSYEAPFGVGYLVAQFHMK